jgi:CheY-like chemotaxis protein
MALFGLSKDKKEDPSSDQVLAYLEEALRRRTPFLLFDSKERETPAHLVGLDEVAGTATFQYQGNLAADKGARITPVFILDGLRIGNPCKCLAVRAGQVDVALPEDLLILERRRHPRVRLNPKEGATLTALSGLFEGIGVTGVIENISEGGARVRVERAMEAKGERKLAPHANLLPKGHPFDLIKVSKLPRIPGKYECPGKAVYLDGGGGGLVMGVSFKAFPSEALGALRSLVSGRVAASPTTLPAKTRKAPDPEPPEEKREKAVAPESHKTPEKEAVAAAPTQPPEPIAVVPEADLPLTELAPESSPPRNQALIRLKKRSRTMLVAADPEEEGIAALVAHLQGEGYGRILVAGTLGELFGALDEPGLGLLFIDRGVAELAGLTLVETLQEVREDLPPILLALEALSAEDVVAAQESGVAHLMVKPFALDEDFSRLVENVLGL